MYLPFCFVVSLKLVLVAPVIAVQPLGTEVFAVPDAEHAYHLYAYVGAPVHVPLPPKRLFPTFAVPETLAALEAEGLVAGVGVGVGDGMLFDQITVDCADEVVLSTVAFTLD